MNKYLTISEFAGLRNVNINSIRYYEKQKILMPAWVDPETKYRYYLPEQLHILDIILLCIRLGIQLKELKAFVDKDGCLNEKQLLERGKDILQKRLSSIEQGLAITQFNLDNLEENQKYSKETERYTREIGERYLFETPFYGNLSDLVQKEKSVMKMFRDAQTADMAPVFPAGILVRCDVCPMQFSFYVQVLHPNMEHERIVTVPTALFQCFQTNLTYDTDIARLLGKQPDLREYRTILISDMLLYKLHYSNQRCEIQMTKNALR